MHSDTSDWFNENNEKKRLFFLAGSTVIFFLLSMLFWAMKETEVHILIWHNSVYENPTTIAWWKWITRYGLNIISFTQGTLMLLSLKVKRLQPLQAALFCALLTYTLGWVAEDWLKELIGRSRPSVALYGMIVNTHISDSFSYPSGHTTKAMALVLPFLFIAPGQNRMIRVLKSFLFLLAALISYSRIPLQLHYPSDILGSIALACMLTLFTLPITRIMYLKWLNGATIRNVFHTTIGMIFIFLAVVFLVIS